MLMSKLVGERTKTSPADATAASHALLIRAGFIKLVSNGIWSLSMPAKRITQKIEAIIREEMNATVKRYPSPSLCPRIFGRKAEDTIPSVTKWFVSKTEAVEIWCLE